MNATVNEQDWGFLEPFVHKLDEIDTSYLLLGAILTDLGDILTTYIGVMVLGIAESNPMAAAAISALGVGGLIAIKVIKYLVTVAFLPLFSRISMQRKVKIAGGLFTLLGIATLIVNTLAITLN